MENPCDRLPLRGLFACGLIRIYPTGTGKPKDGMQFKMLPRRPPSIHVASGSDFDLARVHLGDFNGDSKDDIFRISGANSSVTQLYFSTGNLNLTALPGQGFLPAEVFLLLKGSRMDKLSRIND